MRRVDETRRGLLGGVGLLAAGSLAGCWGRSVPAAEGRDGPATREAFDRAVAAFYEDGGYLDATNDSSRGGESGDLAWGASYVLQALLFMYRATGEERYLERFVRQADAVVEARDSVRGVTDYRGRSLPAWRADEPYTVGSAVLPDAGGEPTLAVRTAASNPEAATVTVSRRPEPLEFGLAVRNPAGNRETTYDRLSMDPADEQYAVRWVNRRGFKQEGPSGCLVTVADRRTAPGGARAPAPGTYEVACPHHVYAVHTGMITLPLATFARVVLESDRDVDDRFTGRARRYREVARKAVAVHADQWRETDDGGGHFVYEPGSPVVDESVALPLNQSLAVGRTLVQLAALTGDPSYADRARKLARLFENDVRTDGSDAAVWSFYWTESAYVEGWPLSAPESEYRPWAAGIPDPVHRRPEDISHGHIDVWFASLVGANSSVFEDGDSVLTTTTMERFARTYVKNVATTVDGLPAARRYVNGTGPRRGGHQSKAALWNGLARWDDRVYDHSASLYDAAAYGSTESDGRVGPYELLGIAMLTYWWNSGS